MGDHQHNPTHYGALHASETPQRRGSFQPVGSVLPHTASTSPFPLGAVDPLLAPQDPLLPFASEWGYCPAFDSGESSGRYKRALARAAGVLMAGLATFSLTTLCWLFFWAAAPQVIGWKTMAITSGSMQPALSVGDAVIVEPGVGSLEPGRLVTFSDPVRQGQIVTHRLVKYNNDGTWTTKGDANTSNDSTSVPTSNVIGTAIAAIPYVGFPTVWRSEGTYKPIAALVSLVIITVVAIPASRRLEELGHEEKETQPHLGNPPRNPRHQGPHHQPTPGAASLGASPTVPMWPSAPSVPQQRSPLSTQQWTWGRKAKKARVQAALADRNTNTHPR